MEQHDGLPCACGGITQAAAVCADKGLLNYLIARDQRLFSPAVAGMLAQLTIHHVKAPLHYYPNEGRTQAACAISSTLAKGVPRLIGLASLSKPQSRNNSRHCATLRQCCTRG